MLNLPVTPQSAPALTCSQCGSPATAEQLTVLRPGQPELHRTVVRCSRAAKTAAERCQPDIRDLALNKHAPLEDPVIQVKACECGCGAPVAGDKRFASRACVAIHAQKFKKLRPAELKPNGPSAHPGPVEEKATMRPEDSSETHRAMSAGDPDLETVIEALRYLRALPREVRERVLALLESIENSNEL